MCEGNGGGLVATDMDIDRVLRDRFGHSGFRPGQREVVCGVLAGRDALAVLPTGGGKSVIYQLPAAASGRCSLVISPLVALMRDQVSQACAKGLRAASIDSTLDTAQRARLLADVREARLELLYAAPEALGRLGADLEGTGAFGLFAVDEAHCISQWGSDFRPDYRALAEARSRLAPVAPILAVTATATSRVERDIVESLGLRDPLVFRGSFFRSNLRLCALRKDRARDGRELVAALLRGCEHGSAIVYRLSRAGATSLAGWLRRRGIPAAAYHAGLDPEHRAHVQEEFLSGRCRVVVATVAFGMGVDKPDVRLVVHADLPDSLESYAQEVGRAGRDGLPSECVLLYSWDDVRRRERLARDADPERRLHLRAAVREMYRFAAGAGCRQRALCAHFGEEVARPCGACDACGAVSAGRLLARGGW
jgi:ATP-dependent DNA helicase RecQ